jgi:hypothetical protein
LKSAGRQPHPPPPAHNSPVWRWRAAIGGSGSREKPDVERDVTVKEPAQFDLEHGWLRTPTTDPCRWSCRFGVGFRFRRRARSIAGAETISQFGLRSAVRCWPSKSDCSLPDAQGDHAGGIATTAVPVGAPPASPVRDRTGRVGPTPPVPTDGQRNEAKLAERGVANDWTRLRPYVHRTGQ